MERVLHDGNHVFYNKQNEVIEFCLIYEKGKYQLEIFYRYLFAIATFCVKKIVMSIY
ncbi:hypothetical protein AQ1689_60007 [Tenacibaculum maritimum]|nr:hypothetical protein AQ1689_60007 [Tenacibaculum maritimum]CAA0184148.1 hypothetical protein AQ1688_50007 [Tenacibaculum maritimum]CAA0187555.1 hypothetical protein AQ1685_60007 [Tenacibaculum maritimum]